jgi:CheY-like chemotaxis protein/phage FluMu protein Com
MPPSQGQPLFLLVVEDDDDFAYLISKCLEQAGHHVTVSPTAEAALGVLAHRRFDLISTGQVLGSGMRGVEFLRAIQRQGVDTPAIMVTGYGDSNLPAEAFDAGALDFLVKDSRLAFPTELPDRVSNALAAPGHRSLDDSCRYHVNECRLPMAEVIACPECNRRLLAPGGNALMVRCPKCAHMWDLSSTQREVPFRADDTVADQPLKKLGDTLADCTDTIQVCDPKPEKQEKVDPTYLAYLEFGADFNWD